MKTEGIPLDNRAFGFESDPAALYFTGTVEVPAIATALRKNDLSILAPSRAGLDWRSADAQRLQNAVHNKLRVLVDRKRREIEAANRSVTREIYRARLRNVCDLLNRLAEQEIEDIPPFGPDSLIEGLTIRPSTGYAKPEEQRRFSVYLPARMSGTNTNPRVTIVLEDVIGDIHISSTSITLAPQRSNAENLSGSFLVGGAALGESCIIYARWQDQEDIAEFRVHEPADREPREPGEPRAPRGLFRNIQFDETPSPIQRVSFNSGEIRIYLNFPTMRKYLGDGGDGMGTPLGSLMCAELVAEAFSREVARTRIEKGSIILLPGGEIDAYNSERDTLSRKYLRDIHDAFVID